MNSTTAEEYIASVLLVDDETDFLELLSERLRNRGMIVTAVTCGEEALGRIDRQDFDIVVIDLSMPGMDGIETIKKIKTRRPQIETIILTGHATLKSGIEAMKSGAEDFLEKPVDIELLMHKIHEAHYKKVREIEKKSRDDVKKILKNRGW